MMLECDSMYCHSPLAHHPDYKSFGYNDNDVERELSKAHKNECMCEFQSKNYEIDGDTFRSELQNGVRVSNVAGAHSLVEMKISTSSKDNLAGDPVFQANIPSSKLESSEKETDFFVDKTTRDCELPELIVCFKEGSCHFVKDICIDEGVRPMVMIKNGDTDGNSDSTVETVDTALPISDGMKFLFEHDSDMDVAKKKFSENLLQKDEVIFYTRDKTEIGVCSKMILPENMHVVEEFDIENSETELSSRIETSEPKLSSFSNDEDKQQFDQDPSKGAILSNTTVSFLAEESKDCSHVSALPFSSKVESGSITFDFKTSSPETSGKQEGSQNMDFQQPLENQHVSGLEDGTSDSLTASSRSILIQNGYGESSFSAIGPPSGPISYSGPIPYSGSLSLRSDSSTTSTRSFAFPILHSELNSSPVKMAKADRRRLRKHQCWRLGVLCCRF